MRLLNNPVLVAFLAILAAWTLYEKAFRPLIVKGRITYQRAAQKETSQPLTASRAIADSSTADGRKTSTVSFVEAEPKRDPFVLAVRELVPKGERLPPADEVLKLSAIVVENDRRLAVVNDKVVKEGDKIDGFVIIEIKPGQIVVESDRGLEAVSLKWGDMGITNQTKR